MLEIFLRNNGRDISINQNNERDISIHHKRRDICRNIDIFRDTGISKRKNHDNGQDISKNTNNGRDISTNLKNGGDVSITQDPRIRLHPMTYSKKFAGFLGEITYLDNITYSCDRIR